MITVPAFAAEDIRSGVLTGVLKPSSPPPVAPALTCKPTGHPQAASFTQSVGGGGESSKESLARELAHKQGLVDRLLDDVERRSTAVARCNEEIVSLRGMNNQLQREVAALRAHLAERDNAIEQLATDATNTDNVDTNGAQASEPTHN